MKKFVKQQHADSTTEIGRSAVHRAAHFHAVAHLLATPAVSAAADAGLDLLVLAARQPLNPIFTADLCPSCGAPFRPFLSPADASAEGQAVTLAPTARCRRLGRQSRYRGRPRAAVCVRTCGRCGMVDRVGGVRPADRAAAAADARKAEAATAAAMAPARSRLKVLGGENWVGGGGRIGGPKTPIRTLGGSVVSGAAAHASPSTTSGGGGAASSAKRRRQRQQGASPAGAASAAPAAPTTPARLDASFLFSPL
ncbi:hypothetical protein MMPV_001721 [Pyropia vietnamensis]